MNDVGSVECVNFLLNEKRFHSFFMSVKQNALETNQNHFLDSMSEVHNLPSVDLLDTVLCFYSCEFCVNL